MAESSFQLEVMTPSAPIFSGAARSLVAPGAEGYLGVLPHHAPLLTALRPGELKVVTAEGETVWLAVGGGFLEVVQNQVVILVDSAESIPEIDLGRAEQAAERARAALNQSLSDVEREQLRQALARAEARIKAARRLRGGDAG